MKKIIAALLALAASTAFAQITPGFVQGQILTAAELNNAFAQAVPLVGANMTGPLYAPTLTSPNAVITGGQISGLTTFGAAQGLFTNVAIGNTTTSFPFQLTSAGGTATVGAVGAIAGTATLGKIFDGSTAAPHTTLTPSVAITRNEAVNSASLSGNSPALWVETVGNNSGAGNPNSNALEAVSTQNGTGDTVGVVGWGIEQGSSGHYAYGGFFNGQANTSGNNAYAIETVTANNTGANAPLNTSAVPNMVGLHVDPMGANNATTALWISKDTNATSAQWDAGIYLSSLSAVSYSLIDESNSNSSLFIGGTHQYGLNLINGTYTGNAIQASGFHVDNSGDMAAAQVGGGAGVTTPGVPLDIETANAVGNSSAAGAVTRIYTGSSAHPVTAITPSVGISRYEAINNIDTEGGQNGALYVQDIGNNTSSVPPIAQVNAITASAQQIGTGDSVGLYATSTNSSTNSGHTAYGMFSNAIATTTGTNAFSVETFTTNDTGANHPLTLGNTPSMVGLHVGTTGTGSSNNNSTAALWVSGDTGGGSSEWDSGLYFSPSSTLTYSIVDDSSSSQAIDIQGSHQYGIVMSNGTFSGNAIQATGFTLGGTGIVNSTGSSNGSNPSTGIVGEYLSNSATAVALTTTTTFYNVTSITLTAGDWMVGGTVIYNPTSASAQQFISGISNTSAASQSEFNNGRINFGSSLAGTTASLPTPEVRYNITATTTIYLIASAAFSAGSFTADGLIWARRMH